LKNNAYSDSTPDFGQLIILYGCKIGKTATSSNGVSTLTRDYIEHFSKPDVQLKEFPSETFLGFKSIASYAELINNTSKNIEYFHIS
jgi:hypothetical protein